MDKPEKLTTLGIQDTRQRQTKQKTQTKQHYTQTTGCKDELNIVLCKHGHHDHDYISPCISNRQNWWSEIRKLMWKYMHIIGFCYSSPLRGQYFSKSSMSFIF